MNDSQIDKLVEAVLYEGFILYPYRPSVKNTQRWTFGGLYPPDFCHSQASVESPSMQVQCLVEGDVNTEVNITLRFLRVVARQIGKLDEPLPVWPADGPLRFVPVDVLTVGERQHRTWQEAIEQRVHIDHLRIGDLAAAPRRVALDAAYERQFEPVYADGRVAGLIVRTQQALNGTAEVRAELVADGCFRLTVRVTNETSLPPTNPLNRDEALFRTFAAANVLIVVDGGELVSQFDPPDERRDLAAANQNQGWWPVLVGDAPDRGAMLAAPIILYDYPQIAPESTTGLFDSTEIDEILSLRIMTLTDDEKRAMRAIDPRSRDLLEHVESLGAQGLLQLHGAARDAQLRTQATSEPPLTRNHPDEPFNPWQTKAERNLSSVVVAGARLTPGDRVRLKPRAGADAFDIFLQGRVATITSLEEDFEGQVHLAVTIDDDPGRDLGEQLQSGHRFFFKTDEVEPVDVDAGSRSR